GFPREDNAVTGAPDQMLVRNHCMECAARAGVGPPDLAARARADVRHPYRPRVCRRATRRQPMTRGDTNEGDARGIRRPDGRLIAVDAGVEKTQTLAGDIVDADEAV